MRFAVIILLLFLQTCGYWRTTSLSSSEVGFIKSGLEDGRVYVSHRQNGMEELSFNVIYRGGRLYTLDNRNRRVQRLDRDGKPELVIGAQKPGGDDVLYANFNFNYIGVVAVDAEERIYIQNRFVYKTGRDKGGELESLDFTPSYVLVFDKKGILQYTLGQMGSPDIPFYYIESINFDSSGRILIISRSFNSWTVSRYRDRVRDFEVNLAERNLVEKEGDVRYNGKIENIKTFQNGEGFLLSVAYYNDMRFKYRKIFEYSVKRNKIDRTVINTPDPKNELFAVSEDRYIYMWNVERRNPRFLVCNFDGGVMSNIVLDFPEKESLFADVKMGDTGTLYSMHVYPDGISLREWK